MADGSRRFPPPWHADKIPGGYVVRDANGQAIAYVYSRAKVPTRPALGIARRRFGAARGLFCTGGVGLRPVFWSCCGPAFQVPEYCEAVLANLDLVLTDRHWCGPANAAKAVTRQRRCRRRPQVGPFRCLAVW
jgi:hypothetical protein